MIFDWSADIELPWISFCGLLPDRMVPDSATMRERGDLAD
jgi:hypothetical protein